MPHRAVLRSDTKDTKIDPGRGLKFFLHQQIGLRIRAVLENMVADKAKAVFFVESLGARIVFPDAQPDHVVAEFFSRFKTFFHQRRADSTAKKILVRIAAVEFNWPPGGDPRFGVIADEPGITGGLTVDLGH